MNPHIGTGQATVEPDPANAGDEVEVSISGVAPGPLYISYARPYCCAFFTLFADEDGESFFTIDAPTPGTYTLKGWQYFKKTRGQEMVVSAITKGGKLREQFLVTHEVI